RREPERWCGRRRVLLPVARRAGGVRVAARPGRHDPGPPVDVAARRRGRVGPGRGGGHGVCGGPAMGRGAERPMVPGAAFESYSGRSIIKPPRWKTPDVPIYLFSGGLAGSSATLAFLGEATGRRELARAGYVTAGAGAVAGTAALIHDL